MRQTEGIDLAHGTFDRDPAGGRVPKAVSSMESKKLCAYNQTRECFLGLEVAASDISFGNLKDMSWTFAQIIERASYGVTLHPGEVIGSGTVGTGCLLELNGSKITDNLWLKPGDTVALEVESLGRLENSVIDGGP